MPDHENTNISYECIHKSNQKPSRRSQGIVTFPLYVMYLFACFPKSEVSRRLHSLNISKRNFGYSTLLFTAAITSFSLLSGFQADSLFLWEDLTVFSIVTG